MPLDASSAEILNNSNSTKKKKSNKKRRQSRKSQSKARNDGNYVNGSSANGIKNALSSNRPDHNKLTAENLASLRWENVLTDSKLENERIERYKELRRQRYNDARENALRNILEQMRLAATTTTTVDNSTGLVEIDQ